MSLDGIMQWVFAGALAVVTVSAAACWAMFMVWAAKRLVEEIAG